MQGFFSCFMSVYRPLISKLNELLDEYGLSYSLWQVINYLENNGPSSLVDISSYHNIEKPSITRRVQRLEERRLIDVLPGKDRREKIIKLTESGEELYQKCRKKITRLEHEVMEGIPKEEQLLAFEILPKIRDNIINEKEK